MEEGQSPKLGAGERGQQWARKETQSPKLEGSRTSKSGRNWNSSLHLLPPCIPRTPGPQRAKTVSCLQSVLLLSFLHEAARGQLLGGKPDYSFLVSSLLGLPAFPLMKPELRIPPLHLLPPISCSSQPHLHSSPQGHPHTPPKWPASLGLCMDIDTTWDSFSFSSA